MLKYIITICIALVTVFQSFSQEKNTNITCAWYHWDPYQYFDESNQLTGLDHALISTIFKDAGIEVQYDKKGATWSANQREVLEGGKDITSGAFETVERLLNYHVSDPYRYEWNSLYIKTNDKELSEITNIDSLLIHIEKHKVKFGVINGYKYTSEKINRFIKKGGDFIIASNKEEENFQNLNDGVTQIIISDRLAGAQIIWKNKSGANLIEHRIKLPEKAIHLLIHKDSVVEKNQYYISLLNNFNSSLKKLKSDGEIDKIIGHYLFPVLMNITVQSEWFYLIDIIGALFFALAGVFIARDNKYDIFGVLILTGLLAVGGGLIRDLIIDRKPVFIGNPEYLNIIIFVGLGGFILSLFHGYFHKRSKKYNAIVGGHGKKVLIVRTLIEAIALGAYTIVGVGVAVEMQLAPLILWGPLLGCLTSCGGGIIANSLSSNNKNATILNGLLEPEVSLFWGAFFSCFLIWQTDRLDPQEVFIGVLVTLVGSTVTLLIISYRKMKSPCIKLDENENNEKHDNPEKEKL